MLDRVTITGADDRVDVSELKKLTDEFPFVEWGILLSQSRMGTCRYPTFEWIRKLLKEKLASDGGPLMQVSGHICGQWVRDIEQKGCFSIVDALREAKCWPSLWWNRFQINWGSRGSKANLDKLREAYTSAPKGLQFILQCPNGDCSSLDAIRRHLADLNFDAVPLVDSSGGRGEVRSEWPQPWTPYSGYAGGLNPDNLEEEYNKIAKRAMYAKIWIDVESGVRDENDQFDFDKVRSFLTQASDWVAQ